MSDRAGPGPAITAVIRAQSATVKASGPRCVREYQPGHCGSRGTTPNVALNPATPHREAGMRIEPPPSEPIASGTIPAATAEPAPPEEPPGTRPGSQRVRRPAVEVVVGDAAVAELGDVGPADHDRPRLEQPLQEGGRHVGLKAEQRARPVGRLDALLPDDVLDADRDAGQRTGIVTRRDPRVDRRRSRAGGRRPHLAEGVEGAVQPCDPLQESSITSTAVRRPARTSAAISTAVAIRPVLMCTSPSGTGHGCACSNAAATRTIAILAARRRDDHRTDWPARRRERRPGSTRSGASPGSTATRTA